MHVYRFLWLRFVQKWYIILVRKGKHTVCDHILYLSSHLEVTTVCKHSGSSCVVLPCQGFICPSEPFALLLASCSTIFKLSRFMKCYHGLSNIHSLFSTSVFLWKLTTPWNSAPSGMIESCGWVGWSCDLALANQRQRYWQDPWSVLGSRSSFSARQKPGGACLAPGGKRG